jgi:branched-chain amino acid transport system substrate-binding protein
LKRSTAAASAAIALLAGALQPVTAQPKGVSDDVVRIGVLVDMAGPYSVGSGMGAVRAVEMAIKDFGGKVLGKPIEVVYADHQNKPDIGATKAREWFDTGKVDMVIDVVNSAVAVAVQKLATEKKRVLMVTGSGSIALSNQECSPYAIQYAYDTYALATGVVRAVAPEAGKKWYFISVDYTFGAALEADARATLATLGGQVVGAVKHPLNAADYSSYVLSAQAAKPDVVAIASGGGDFANALKATREFGLGAGGKPVVTGLFVVLSDLKALGLNVAQGLQYVDPFYWDQDEAARAWSHRFFAVHKAMPAFNQAADYSAVTQYLKAISEIGTDDADAVMTKLRNTKFNDFFLKNGYLRADGRMVHDMALWEAKKPSESKGEWDLAKRIRDIPGEEAAKPLAQSNCPLIKK